MPELGKNHKLAEEEANDVQEQLEEVVVEQSGEQERHHKLVEEEEHGEQQPERPEQNHKRADGGRLSARTSVALYCETWL